ncbi:calcium-binding protein [Paraburkholderia adhaesiva]|uniref:calcium-binding protein n=1 Tax=Paraburkholderia adhaesiva TaxID=2883244 RepID=UPI001F30C736|nr:calcium-binding protein [Paraburkholderia adhaesiva]
MRHPFAAVVAPLARIVVAHGSRHARAAHPCRRLGARTVASFAALLYLYALTGTSVAQEADVVRVMRADAFLETLAVNTHVNYTDGAYANVRNIADDLAWLGIHHVRDAPPASGAAPLASYVYLAQHGIKFNVLMHLDIADHLDRALRLNAEVPGSVVAIEGLNEIDNWPVTYGDLKGADAGLAVQREIYTRVRGTPALAGVPVYDLTGYDIKPVDTRTNAADYANGHVYPQNGEQPMRNANGDSWMGSAVRLFRKFHLPMVITEFGYFSMPQSGWYMIGVDEPAQAKGVLNGYMDAAAAGVKRTYVYELLDQKPDPQNKNAEMHFGLFRIDNSPKPVASAIRNLTSILKDDTKHSTNGAAGGTLAYTLSGMPPLASSLLLQKNDGRFVLVLWNETQIWDRATGTPVANPPASVGLDLGASASRVNVYDPLVSDKPRESHRDVRRLDVSVPDHPVLIEVTLAHREPA